MSERIWPRAQLWPIPDAADYLKNPTVCLNGTWKLNGNPPENFFAPDCDVSGWEDFPVPGNTSFRQTTEYAYARDIDVPAEWQGNRVVIRFEGANCEARVWVNGHYAGWHYGGFVSWDCDITDYVKPGETARLVVGIHDRPREVCSFHSGGLIRNVFLYAQPETHLMRIQADTYFDETYTDSRLVVRTGAVSLSGKTATVKAYLDGQLLGEAEAPSGQDVNMEYLIPAPRKWDSEHPNLYDLTVKLFLGGEEIESSHKKIGFREVKRIEDQVFVNGQEVKLHGVNRHDIHPLTGRAITHELVEEDVKLFKEANVNFIRTSHYPPRPDFLDLCDQYGIYIEDETSVAFLGQTIQYSMSDPAYTSKFMNTFAAQIERDKSHPCVIVWSLANESYYGDNLRMMNAYARQEDPERLTIFSYPITMQDDDERVDIWSVHYADWDTDVACLLDQWKRGYSWPTPNKYPVLHDESTHIPCHDPKDLKRDPGIRNFWGETIRQFWDRIWNRRGALGCAIWAGIDDVWYRPGSDGHGAQWGIFDGWRRKKPEWWHVRKGYSPIHVVKESFTCYGEPRVDVINRFNHTNMNEVTISWSAAGKSGSFKGPNTPPRGMCTISFPVALRPGEELNVSFTDSQGYQVDESCLVHQANPVKAPVANAGAPVVTESDCCLTLTGDNCELVISKVTGKIVKGVADGKTVVVGGPHLQLTGLALPEWKLDKLTWENVVDCVNLYIRGTYGKVRVAFRMAVDKAGMMVTDYTIEDMPFNSPHNQAFSECGHDVGGYEEVGLAFDTPADLDTLSWKKRGMWDVYPEWHTDRLEGKAKRFAEKTYTHLRDVPTWEWKDDEREWGTFGKYDVGGRGTYDFRSMKNYIYAAAMENEEGSAFRAFSDGTDSVRAEAQYADSCIYNDDDPSIAYTGNWLRVNTRSRSWKGEHMMCYEKGGKAEFTFNGTGCVWYTTTDIICGTANVYLDGVFQEEIDLGSSVRLSVPRGNEAIYNEIAYSCHDLPLGEHKLTIEVTGNKGKDDQSSYVIIDRMVVLREGNAGNVRFIVNNEYNYPDLTWGCYYNEPVLVGSGYTKRVTTKLG